MQRWFYESTPKCVSLCVRSFFSDFSARGVHLDSFSFVDYYGVFTIARPLFMHRNFSHGFFLLKGVIEMKVNNFLVCDFFIAISLLKAFSLQSENDEIL